MSEFQASFLLGFAPTVIVFWTIKVIAQVMRAVAR